MNFVSGVFGDCRHALRLYSRTPGASLVAVTGFAVAMAAVAAFVSLYVDLVLRPHAGFEPGNRLVTFGWTDGRRTGGLPDELIDRIAEEATTLEAAAGASFKSFQIGAERQQVAGEMVTREFFPGVRPRLALGRGFERDEHAPDGEPVVVISHAFWQREFGGRVDVLGETIRIDGQANFVALGPDLEDPEGPTDFRIVGVMDEQLPGTYTANAQTAFWIPAERALAFLGGDINATNAAASMRGIGRRAPNASTTAIARELEARYAGEIGNRVSGLTGVRYDVLDGLVFDAAVQRDTQRQLSLFLGAGILLALVAAANVSLFLLARAPGRQRELGVRMAVGAPMRRLARQLASEAAALVLVAAILGLAISVWLAEFLRGLTFLREAQWRDVTLLDWRVIGIVSLVVLALTVLVSLAPIFGLKRLGIAGSSRKVSARPNVTQRVAGAVQIAVASTLGAGAIALGWYIGTLILGDPGYQIRDRHVLSYSIEVRVEEGALVGTSVADKARRREAILSLPGVTAVSLAGHVPGLGPMGSQNLSPPGNPDQQIRVQRTIIDSHYVDLLGLRLLNGRSPTDAEPNAILVNSALARALWGTDDVIGQPLTMPVFGGLEQKEIVGVLADLSFEHPAADVEPIVFLTSGIVSTRGLAVIRSSMTSGDLRQALQGLIDSGALEVNIEDVTTLGALRNDTIASDRARSALAFAAAALVVLLAVIGFYGTQRYLVTAGRREYAIRASLGAGPRALGRLVIWRGLQLGLPGLVFGLPLAFLVVAWLRDDFVSRDASPVAVSIAVAVGLAALVVAASLGPALQARLTQPAPLLREE